MIGIASTSPHTSHIHPQKSTDTNTVTVFNSPARLVSHGEMRLPSTAATTPATPTAAAVIPNVWNWTNATRATSATAIAGPMKGTTFSTPAINPSTNG